MPSEKRNHFLDVEDSDDDGSQGYDSEAEQVQKGARTSKRRKLDDAGSDEEDALSGDEGNSSEEEIQEVPRLKPDAPSANDATEKPEGEKPDPKSKSRDKPELPDVSRPLTKKNLVASEAAVRRSGVIYVSRIPPFMKPTKLRSLLEPYGKINRIFCSPEDPQARSRRIRQGGNKKQSFTEGWVEFCNKKDAKAAVELLNGHTIGGKKSSYYRDDIWALKYLKGFKWNNLTEQIASEAAERASRMRAEISKSTREAKDFVRNIEKAKMLEGIQAKATAKKSRDEESPDKAVSATPGDSKQPKSMRKFKQSLVGRAEADKTPEEAKRVLSKLF
ncbi:Pre-rRNA-processing protein ESF2 [Biscogniauxia mediterranea]|nr:Pre-rRNA-processing protein ESF2 [Biscogniauxia mediterranea]